ncbi:hypothetical protein LCGC14_2056470, partial [marine sediment metagenome]
MTPDELQKFERDQFPLGAEVYDKLNWARCPKCKAKLYARDCTNCGRVCSRWDEKRNEWVDC